MLKRIAGFDWDPGNLDHCRKHGVTQADVERLFRNSPATSFDREHSDGEARFFAVGQVGVRWLFVVFTFRVRDGQRWLRPISARPMHQKEVQRYVKAASGL